MKIQCTCAHCKTSFMKTKGRVNYSIKNGHQHFCSRSCTSSHTGLRRLVGYDISKHSSNLADEFTGFRDFLRRAKTRGKDFNLTLQDLKDQWDKQKGLCPYSGVELILPNPSKKTSFIYLASLDRIDSGKGYIAGNIQFTSSSVNLMKNRLSHEETLVLCSLIAKSYWNLGTDSNDH